MSHDLLVTLEVLAVLLVTTFSSLGICVLIAKQTIAKSVSTVLGISGRSKVQLWREGEEVKSITCGVDKLTITYPDGRTPWIAFSIARIKLDE